MTTPGGEAARKGFHVGLSLAAAAMIAWLPPLAAAAVLAAATAVALSIELLRRIHAGFGSAFQSRLGVMMRSRETHRLTGATTLSVGYTAAAVLLPGLPALAGVLYTGIADAGAAVVGRRYGHLRYPGGKSIEGSLVFLALVFLLTILLPGGSPGAALGVALALTLAEAPTLRIDDNLYLPLAGAAAVRLILGAVGPTIFP
jgi:dolichol kinase